MRAWWQRRASGLARTRLLERLSPDTWAILAIAAAVLVANALFLLDLSDPNPLGPRSGLVSSQVFGPFGGQPTIDPNNGFISQALSHRAALDVLHLRLPWWNPYEGTGAPLLGETQSAAFFPPTLLTAISNGQLFERILLELIAGVATFRLLRRLELGRLSATAGAIAFALNGTFAWFWHATFNPVAFLPLLLLGVEHAYDAARAQRSGGWMLLALAGALSVYAGFPEVAYIDALMAGAWLLWRAGCLERSRRPGFARKLLIGALTGTLLAAPQLVALLDYFSAQGDLSFHATPLFGALHLNANALPQLLLPYVYGPIFDYAGSQGQGMALWGVVGGYLSAGLVLFALVGSFGRRLRGLRMILLVFWLLVFARMYGQVPVLGHVIGLLPGMQRVAFFRYGYAALELSVIVLAALGLDDLARSPERARLRTSAVAGLALVAVAARGARPLAHALGAQYAHRPYYWGAVLWAVLIVACVLGAGQVRRLNLRSSLLAGVLVLDVLAQFITPELSAPRALSVDLAPAAYLKRHLGTERFFTLGPLAPNYGSYFALASLNINDIPIPKRFEAYVHTRLDPYVDPTVFVGNFGGGRSPLVPTPQQELIANLDAYREAAVAYVLSPAGQALPEGPRRFALVARTPTTWIYRLDGAPGYFSASGCSVRSAGRARALVDCAQASMLIRRETYFPGWSASMDGHSTPIRRYEGLFQAVHVPAGRHSVSFAFVPRNIGWGGLGFAGGCLLLVGGALSARRPAGAGARGRGARPSR